MKNAKTKPLIILFLSILFVNFIPFQPSKAVSNIVTETWSGTLEDHDWVSSSFYSLTNGDQIGIQLIVTDASDHNSNVDIYLESPQYTGDPLNYYHLGYCDYNDYMFYDYWTVLTHLGDAEGNHRIRVTNQGLTAGGDGVTVDITFWKFSNNLAQGNILTPSDNERVEGTTTLSWSFQDADVNDELKYDVYYQTGYTTTLSEFYESVNQHLGTTSESYLEWDTTQHFDGLCTILLIVKEWYISVDWNYVVKNYYLIHPEIDNDNDPPSVNILTPVTGNEYSSELTITYTGDDPNEDDLTYSLYYASDGVTFDKEITKNIGETSYKWNVSAIPDGENYRVKVTVKDEHGMTMDGATGKFTINNPEYVKWISPEETVNELLQTVKIQTNAISAELFVNSVSKGKQTEGFEWTILLSEGINELNIKVEDSLGTETTFTKFVTYKNTTTSATATTTPPTEKLPGASTNFIPISMVIFALIILYRKKQI